MSRPANGKLQNRNILISGASAAGPSLAYWLHHYGFNPTVVERAPALRTGGYAIDLRGAAVHVAERMGILAEARKASTDLREVLFVDSKNETLATMDANFGAGPGRAGDVELLRDDLAQILYAATKDTVNYIFGDSIASLSQHDQGVEVTFEHGAPRTFDPRHWSRWVSLQCPRPKLRGGISVQPLPRPTCGDLHHTQLSEP
jgi:2-polyprenyl-6-methoxyphenol hydroxylase-like FAD-dependent oxidoreductase